MDLFFIPLSSGWKRVAATTDLQKSPKAPLYSRYKDCLEAYTLMSLRMKRLDVEGRMMDLPSLAASARAAAEVTGCLAESARVLLQPFLQCEMSPRAVEILCWQVAGNRKRLKNEECHLYGGRKAEMGWMAAKVAELHTDSSGGNSYRFRVNDGPAAGLDLYAKVPKYLRGMSDLTGYTRRLEDNERIRMHTAIQAVGCEVLVLPDPVSILSWVPEGNGLRLKEDSRKDSAGLIRVTSNQKQFNHLLSEDRAKKCDKGLSGPCHSCPIGYDVCRRSCRPHSAGRIVEAADITIEGRNLCPMKKPESSSEPA